MTSNCQESRTARGMRVFGRLPGAGQGVLQRGAEARAIWTE